MNCKNNVNQEKCRDLIDVNTNNDSQSFKESLLTQLQDASPLDTFSILEQIEMYDKQNAYEVIDEVYEKFQSGEQRVENIVIPVFTSIIDGFVSETNFGRDMNKKGLTTTRIVEECRHFNYENQNTNTAIFSELTKDNAITQQNDHHINEKVGTKISNYYRNKGTAEKHGDEYFNFTYTDSQRERAKQDNIDKHDGVLTDEYTGKEIYDKKTAIKKEGNTQNAAEYDHNIPLSKVHEQLKNNCMLTNEDVRNIANIEENLSFTSQRINRSKQDKSNKEYVENNKETLDRKTRRNMRRAEKRAQKAIDKEANKTVIKNLVNPDTEEKKEQRQKLYGELDNVAKDSARAGINMCIVDVMLELLKPLYFEISDCFKNGFAKGVGIDNNKEAIIFRINRIKNHLKKSLLGLGLGSLLDTIKSIVSSIISAILDLFFGIIKTLATLIRKCFPVAVSAFKVLMDKSKSRNERGDAFVKLVGGAVISIVGGILIDKIKIFDNNSLLKSIATALLTGCGSLIFMFLLDKLDLFNVKAEKRAARIEEIFDARAKDMEERISCMQVDAINLLRNQCLCFDKLINGAEKAIKEKDVDKVVQYSYAIADFFKVELEYTNTAEFVEWWDKQKVICL